MPNPVRDSFNINFDNVLSNKNIAKVIVTDSSGKIVKIFMPSEGPYNISELIAGVYFVVFSDGEIKVTKKIIKE